MENKFTISEMTVDAQLLYKRISAMTEGETIDYKELSSVIHRSVTSNRHLLYSAIKLARQENAMVFDAVRGVGIKRLKNEEITSTVSSRVLKKIRLSSKLAQKKITCVNYNSLSKAEQTAHNASLSILGAMRAFASAGSLTKISSAIERSVNNKGALPLMDTLAVFK